MPCRATLCPALPGWSRGPALPRLCQAVAVQVTGLSRAAAGCELPAKRAVGTSTTAHCPSRDGTSGLLTPPGTGLAWGALVHPLPFCPPSPSILTVPTDAVGTAVLPAQLGFGTHSTLPIESPAPKGCPPTTPSLQRPPADGAMLGTQSPWGCPDGCGERWGCRSSGCLPCSPTHCNHARGHLRWRVQGQWPGTLGHRGGVLPPPNPRRAHVQPRVAPRPQPGPLSAAATSRLP